MSINMQGSWTVSVKSKSAAFPQRFIISGAATGNGTYAGETSTPPVYVTGDSWSITIQNKPSNVYVDSYDQITFPTVSEGQYRFNIESNDAGQDEDFDDLILTCSTPVTATDFLIYGSVRYYSEACIFNPCFFGRVVIDNLTSLQTALKNPVLKIPIEKLYPDRLRLEPPHPGPIPDPPPFRPIVIPVNEGESLPPKKAQIIKLERTLSTTKAKASSEALFSVSAIRTISLERPATSESIASIGFDRIAVGGIIDELRPRCKTGPLPGIVLRFQEYDRTNAELAGGPYTGTGNREILGACATDRNGNYIFRFYRSLAQFFEEANIDVAAGGNEVAQSMPDIIPQVLDPMATTGVAYESAPYSNIPLLKRINICMPKGNLPHLPTACQGGRAIQAIGNIFVISGVNNFLSADGRVTAKNTLPPGTPPARCAAWRGNLDFFACFLDHPDVKYYTIRYSRMLPDNTWSPWSFFQQEYRHPKIVNIGIPGYNGDLVGPFDRQLYVDGNPQQEKVKAYDNIEYDPAWVITHRDRKAVISSWLYAPETGTVRFKIEGYNDKGHKVAGAEDTITLFIDNSDPDYFIREVFMLGSVVVPCSLITLPPGQLNAPIRVKFKADQVNGFMESYDLKVKRCNTGLITSRVDEPGLGQLSGSYSHTDDVLCNKFHGTFDDPPHDASGIVTVKIEPKTGSNWLNAGQSFGILYVEISCRTRATNGYNDAVIQYHTKTVTFGLQQ